VRTPLTWLTWLWTDTCIKLRKEMRWTKWNSLVIG